MFSRAEYTPYHVTSNQRLVRIGPWNFDICTSYLVLRNFRPLFNWAGAQGRAPSTSSNSECMYRLRALPLTCIRTQLVLGPYHLHDLVTTTAAQERGATSLPSYSHSIARVPLSPPATSLGVQRRAASSTSISLCDRPDLAEIGPPPPS
jgi:hypothetical protein